MEININQKTLQQAISITGINNAQELIEQALISFVQQKVVLNQALEDNLEELDALSSNTYLNSIEEARQDYKNNKTYSINDI